MKNLIASGFLFVGGAIMTLAGDPAWLPHVGFVCAAIGLGMLLYYVFGNDGDA